MIVHVNLQSLEVHCLRDRELDKLSVVFLPQPSNGEGLKTWDLLILQLPATKKK